MITVVYSLEWSDLDPATHHSDPAPARAIAEALVLAAAGHDGRTRGDRHALAEAIDQARLGEYGAWIAGWQWSANEPGCGGPVHAWCCASHSLRRDDEPDPRASAARVVAAVSEWRDYVVDLAAQFAELRAELAGLPLEDLVERAAARLLPAVIASDRPPVRRDLRHVRGDSNRRRIDVPEHVITRAGLALHAAEPLFVVARAADDPRGAWCLAYVIESQLGRPA